MKPLTPEEVDAIDAATIDSVTGDRLIATVRSLRSHMDYLGRAHSNYVHMQVALWLAYTQGGWDEAAEWITNGVDQWIDIEEVAADPWAHDWRKFWNSRDSITGAPAHPCGICGEPSTITSGTPDNRMGACGPRHWKAMKGELPDEQCRLCNRVVVCAHSLDASPVCADCWPGERLLAERRAAWSLRVRLL